MFVHSVNKKLHKLFIGRVKLSCRRSMSVIGRESTCVCAHSYTPALIASLIKTCC